MNFLQSFSGHVKEKDMMRFLYQITNVDEIPIPHDLNVERKILGGLASLYPGDREQWFSRLNVDDFYLGRFAFNGFIFMHLESRQGQGNAICELIDEYDSMKEYGVDDPVFSLGQMLKVADIESIERDINWLVNVSVKRRNQISLMGQIGDIYRTHMADKEIRNRTSEPFEYIDDFEDMEEF